MKFSDLVQSIYIKGEILKSLQQKFCAD